LRHQNVTVVNAIQQRIEGSSRPKADFRDLAEAIA
jgi:hypothetical protein